MEAEIDLKGVKVAEDLWKVKLVVLMEALGYEHVMEFTEKAEVGDYQRLGEMTRKKWNDAINERDSLKGKDSRS